MDVFLAAVIIWQCSGVQLTVDKSKHLPRWCDELLRVVKTREKRCSWISCKFVVRCFEKSPDKTMGFLLKYLRHL